MTKTIKCIAIKRIAIKRIAIKRIAIKRIAAVAALLIAVSGFSVQPGTAQDRRQNEPGQFDFYVLSLSWSPSFCDYVSERSPASVARQPECGDRPFAFVVHGLWPQYDRGFPEFCQNPAPRLDRNIVSSMLDLMPSPRLIFHEWDRHGVCSGLPPRAYFETIRKARAAVKIPSDYIDLAATKTVSPNEVQEAFLAANPGLSRDGIAIGCDNRRLNEVRICLSKDL